MSQPAESRWLGLALAVLTLLLWGALPVVRKLLLLACSVLFTLVSYLSFAEKEQLL